MVSGKENTSQNTRITHISARSESSASRLKELLQYRDFIVLWTKKTLTLSYKQTILGPLWLIITPLLSAVTYMLVFGRIAGIRTDGIPQILFYLVNNAAWRLFSSCFQNNARTFTANANLFGKVYFPRLSIPVSNLFAALILFLIEMAIVLVVFVWYLAKGAVQICWQYLWAAVPAVLVIAVLGMSAGIIISSLTTRYRDLSVLVSFGTQLLMYATPVVYPVSQISDPFLQKLILLNPLSAPMETLRLALFGSGMVVGWSLWWSLACTVLLLVCGVRIFGRVERTFMDTV